MHKTPDGGPPKSTRLPRSFLTIPQRGAAQERDPKYNLKYPLSSCRKPGR